MLIMITWIKKGNALDNEGRKEIHSQRHRGWRQENHSHRERELVWLVCEEGGSSTKVFVWID